MTLYLTLCFNRFGSDEIPTPHIDKLANEGIILNNYYVQPICTPSRSALMTGKYPIHTGMFLFSLPIFLLIMREFLFCGVLIDLNGWLPRNRLSSLFRNPTS